MDSAQALRRIPLDALHRELGAKMVAFAGHLMPLHYPAGIITEHKHTRNRAGFFDISHMGQIRVSGPDGGVELEKLVPGEVSGLPPFRQLYTVFTTESGGVFDDLMLTNAGDHYFLVVNASRKEEDQKRLIERMPAGFRTEMMTEQALFALQGPEAATVLARLAPGSEALHFMTSGRFSLGPTECFISRCGYTGEDGFEISLPADEAERVARALLEQPEVAPIGLGARDTLRLEAGLCLYGHELDESTTPVEAGLSWVIAKRHLENRSEARFPGAGRILEQIRGGTARKRVGLVPEGKAPVRDGAEILNERDQIIGRVTSGGFGPSLGGPLAMAYLDSAFAVEGNRVSAILRKRRVSLKISKLPFVPHRYSTK